MLLARRFILNPVLVIISLVFWFWMWGAPGAILSVPMLAITKIICDRIRPLAAFGHFLEGSRVPALAARRERDKSLAKLTDLIKLLKSMGQRAGA